MFTVKKEISLETSDGIVEKLLKLETKAPTSVSLTTFIERYFQEFIKSGKTTREIYEFLKEEKVDVSSFQVFKTLYSKVKKTQKLKSASSTKAPVSDIAPPKSVNPTQKVPDKEQKAIQNGDESNVRKEPQLQGKVSKYNPNLTPIMLPGGVEAFIDPETGGKGFEIS